MPKPPLPAAMPKTPVLSPLAARINALGAGLRPNSHPKPSTAGGPAKGLKRACGICGQLFTNKQPNAKYCSVQCKQAGAALVAEKHYKPPKYPAEATCGYCCQPFLAKTSTNRWCSENCRKLSSLPTGNLVNRRAYPKGVYVYGWYKDKDQFPFYIGKGQGSRKTQRHSLGNVPALCQRIRNECKDFRVVVYRDRLTDEGAMLVESVIIELFTSMGALLSNQLPSLNRTEQPPLEM